MNFRSDSANEFSVPGSGKKMRFCIYQQKNLGDALLTTPVVSFLCARSDVESVTVFCKPGASAIFERISEKVKVVSWCGSAMHRLSLLLNFRVDVMLLPHRSRTGFFIGLFAGARCLSVGPIRRILWFSPQSLPVRVTPWRHTAEVNLDLLRALKMSVPEDAKRISLKSLLDNTVRLPDGLPIPYIVVHPGSRWMFKSPALPVWEEIVKGLKRRGFHPVLTGQNDGEEGELLRTIATSCQVMSLAGTTSLSQLTTVISEAQGYLGVDTFATHIAAGAGIPGLALYGPTSALIWGPYGLSNRLKVIASNNHPCMPCHTDGCGGGKRSECLDDLDPVEIVNKFNEIVG